VDRTGVRDGARPDVGSPEANFVIEDGFAMPKGEKARIAANIAQKCAKVIAGHTETPALPPACTTARAGRETDAAANSGNAAPPPPPPGQLRQPGGTLDRGQCATTALGGSCGRRTPLPSSFAPAGGHRGRRVLSSRRLCSWSERDGNPPHRPSRVAVRVGGVKDGPRVGVGENHRATHRAIEAA
jgi:hypothetical protein